MKRNIILISIIFLSNFSFGQDLKFGIEISPSFKLQSIKSINTGLYSSINGYGFNFGIPVKVGFFDDRSLSTGIIYQFTAFDNKFNNYLISSNRLHSIDVPMIYNYPVADNIYFDGGGGISYIFSSREYGGGVWVSRNSTTRKIQPYFAIGGSTIIEQNNNSFELSIHAKAHPFNLWIFGGSTLTRLIAFDFNLKYYF